jgi:hypothetical protein
MSEPNFEGARDVPSASGTDAADPLTSAEQNQQVVPFEDFLVDEAGMETFPASDPPSWTPLITMGHPHQRLAPAEPVPNADETSPSSPQTKSSD